MWLKNVDWWYKTYTVFGHRVGVSWKMVLIMVIVWVGMFVFLPGGLIF